VNSSSKKISTSEVKRPTAIKILNGLGSVVTRLGGGKRLEVNRLIASARKKSGCSQGVENDFLEPLRVMVDAINDTANLDFFGALLAEQTLITALANQMSIRAQLESDPAILAEKIESPLFVIGFPRTGTTLMHNLLALDDNCRAPMMWEVLNPTLASRVDEKERQRRIKQAEAFTKFAYYLVPSLKKIHALTPQGPDECLKLIENSFVSPHFSMYFDMPDYWQWLLTEGESYHQRVYEYHRTQLQLLQHGSSISHWVLKTPLHLFFLDALLKVYPDARIVNMVRDPLECIPSFCSLIAVNRGIFTDKIEQAEIGRFGLQFYVESYKRANAAIQSAEPGRIISVQYRDFVKGPLQAVRSIYDHFNMPLSSSFETNVEQWLVAHPQNKHGVHSYSLKQFGIDHKDIQNVL
jgi:hypothetical protein